MTFVEELKEIERQIETIRRVRLELETRCSGIDGVCPCEPIHTLRNGEEVEYLCNDCFKDALYDLLLSNRRLAVVERQHNDWEVL